MATVKVKQASIDELKSAITFSAEQTSQAAELVAKAVNGISGMSFSAKYGLESELSSLKSRLSKQAQMGQACYRAVQEAVDALIQVDDSSGSLSAGAWGKITSQVNTVFGAVAAGLSLAAKDKLGKQTDINDLFIDGDFSVIVTPTPDIIGGGQNKTIPTNQNSGLPDWAKEYSDIYSESFQTADRGTGWIATNNYDGSVACTFYTLRKLRERGLGFPFQSSGVSYNGSEWFGNCTKDVPKAAGTDAIETLLSGRDSLENVVVSFPPSTNTFGCGHVMLIDKVYKDSSTGQTMVSFSDNYDYEAGQVLYDASGTSHISTWTLDKFKNDYIKFHGGITGAVLIGS